MRRSDSHLTALQSRCSLSKIFRPAGSRIVFAMVPQMGSPNSPRAEVEWLFFPERWRRAVEPDAAPRNPHDAVRFVRVTKHHPLDQIDRCQCCDRKSQNIRPSPPSSAWPERGGREAPGEGRTRDKNFRTFQADQFETIPQRLS